jgi:rubrerythrin
METIDKEMAARVWQRVHPQPQVPQSQGLLGLITQELTNAVIYLQLARRLQGRQSVLLRKLAQQEQTHAACLKGIYTLITGEHPKARAIQPDTAPVEVLLRKCYGAQMRSLAQYEQRMADPEYGKVFAGLAEQERQNCQTLLAILGM